eukprot:2176742-Pyramimonas_sp.AAC.1
MARADSPHLEATPLRLGVEAHVALPAPVVGVDDAREMSTPIGSFPCLVTATVTAWEMVAVRIVRLAHAARIGAARC